MSHAGPARKGSPAARADAALRRVALGYPDAYEDHPWGHSAYKVRGKVFVFVAASEEGLGVSAKLPSSGPEALLLPFASPTGYGLGKSGWVSASFGPKESPPLAVLSEWIDESYRAIAPKKLVAELDGAPPSGPKKKAAAKKKATKKKATKKKAAKKKAAKKKAARARPRRK